MMYCIPLNRKLKIMKKYLIFLSGLLIGVSALAAEEASVAVRNAWARESPPTVTTGVAYMTLVNRGDETDRLMAVSGEVAEAIELHDHIMENGVMTMRPVEFVEIEPGKSAVFESGGLHIMMIDLNEPLVAGRDFPLMLRFEKAGKVLVEVVVKKD